MSDWRQRLRDLEELLDAGVLSSDEFELEKQKLIQLRDAQTGQLSFESQIATELLDEQAQASPRPKPAKPSLPPPKRGARGSRRVKRENQPRSAAASPRGRRQLSENPSELPQIPRPVSRRPKPTGAGKDPVEGRPRRPKTERKKTPKRRLSESNSQSSAEDNSVPPLDASEKVQAKPQRRRRRAKKPQDVEAVAQQAAISPQRRRRRRVSTTDPSQSPEQEIEQRKRRRKKRTKPRRPIPEQAVQSRPVDDDISIGDEPPKRKKRRRPKSKEESGGGQERPKKRRRRVEGMSAKSASQREESRRTKARTKDQERPRKRGRPDKPKRRSIFQQSVVEGTDDVAVQEGELESEEAGYPEGLIEVPVEPFGDNESEATAVNAELTDEPLVDDPQDLSFFGLSESGDQLSPEEQQQLQEDLARQLAKLSQRGNVPPPDGVLTPELVADYAKRVNRVIWRRRLLWTISSLIFCSMISWQGWLWGTAIELQNRAALLGWNLSISPPFANSSLATLSSKVNTAERLPAESKEALRNYPSLFQHNDLILGKRLNKGIFFMGNENGESNEQPLHPVLISRDFYIMPTEVTQGLYEEISGTNLSSFQNCPQCPIDGVSWLDAVKFANQLSSKMGLSSCYVIKNQEVTWADSFACMGWRLPTEAEWEYAAKARRIAPDKASLTAKELRNEWEVSVPFAGGQSPDEVGWYKANSLNKTHPVASKMPNDWGLYDLSGNVWEWCFEPYDSEIYSLRTKKNPGVVRDPRGEGSYTQGSGPVRRGGSWEDPPKSLKITYRDDFPKKMGTQASGFRLVRTAE